MNHANWSTRRINISPKPGGLSIINVRQGQAMQRMRISLLREDCLNPSLKSIHLIQATMPHVTVRGPTRGLRVLRGNPLFRNSRCHIDRRNLECNASMSPRMTIKPNNARREIHFLRKLFLVDQVVHILPSIDRQSVPPTKALF